MKSNRMIKRHMSKRNPSKINLERIEDNKMLMDSAKLNHTFPINVELAKDSTLMAPDTTSTVPCRISPSRCNSVSAASKFNAWSNPTVYLSYGGFDKFERQDTILDSLGSNSRRQPSRSDSRSPNNGAICSNGGEDCVHSSVFELQPHDERSSLSGIDRVSILDDKQQLHKAALDPESLEPYQDPESDFKYGRGGKKYVDALGRDDFASSTMSQDVSSFQNLYAKQHGTLLRPSTVGAYAYHGQNLLQLCSVTKENSIPVGEPRWIASLSRSDHNRRTWTVSSYGIRRSNTSGAFSDESTKEFNSNNVHANSLVAISPAALAPTSLLSSSSSLISSPISSPIPSIPSTSSCKQLILSSSKAFIGSRVDLSNDEHMAQLIKVATKSNQQNSTRTLQKCTSVMDYHLPPNHESEGRFSVFPREIYLGTIKQAHVYDFPLRIRNESCRQDRFYAMKITASSGGQVAPEVRIRFHHGNARLAPGLSTIVHVEFHFSQAGIIDGELQIDIRGRKISIPIVGEVGVE